MNVLLSSDYIIPTNQEGKVDVLFDGNYTLTFIFNKMESSVEKNYKNIEMMRDESVSGKHSVYRINYTDEDSTFGIVRNPTKLFIRTTKRNETEYKEHVKFNFSVSKILGVALLFKLIVLSESL